MDSFRIKVATRSRRGRVGLSVTIATCAVALVGLSALPTSALAVGDTSLTATTTAAPTPTVRPTASTTPTATATATQSATESATRTPTTPPPIWPTPSPVGGGQPCTATYAVTASWPGNFQAAVTVRNDGPAVVSRWQVRWTYVFGETISQMLGGVLVSGSPSVVVVSGASSGSLPVGATARFEFHGTTPQGTGPTVWPSCTAG
jgi:hypothetical protein